MGGPGPGASFFGGFAKGFAGGMLAKKDRERKEELENEARQYQIMQDALHTATQRGDMDAVANIFRSMEEFTTAGTGKKGKKKKEAQEGVLSQFANMIQGTLGRGATGEAPTSQINLDEGKPPVESQAPEPPSSPILRKPFFKTNQQLDQDKINYRVAEQEATMPGEIEQYKQQQIIMGNRLKEQRKADADARLAAAMTKLDAQEQLRATRRVRELAAATGDETKAKELYLEEIQTGLEQKQASTNLMNVRSSLLPEQFRLQQEKASRLSQHYDQLEARARELSIRGDKRLSQAITQKNYKGIIASMNGDLGRMRMIESEINNKSRIATNTLVPLEDREQAKRELADMTRQYNELNTEVENKQRQLEELDSIGGDIGGEGATGTTGTSTSTPSTGGKSRKVFGLRLPPSGKTTTRPHKVIVEKSTGKKYKFYGYKPDGSPDIEPIP